MCINTKTHNTNRQEVVAPFSPLNLTKENA